jgi:hypothetical protein
MPILEAGDYEGETEARIEVIKEKWQTFLADNLPLIQARILEQRWANSTGPGLHTPRSS